MIAALPLADLWLADSPCGKALCVMTVPMHDTLVIGGGISGLTCALLRATKGQRVVLVERSPHLAPTLRGFVRRGTYLDSGFHYAGSLGPGGLLLELLEKLGIAEALDGAVCLRDTVDHVRFSEPAFEFSFPQGWEALEQELCQRFPADGVGAKSLLSEMRTLWEQSRRAFVQDGGQSLHLLFAGPVRSLQQAVERCTDDPVLRGLLCCHGILYGTLARETSLLFHSQAAGSYFESACLIRGGGRVLVEVFEEVLRKAEVEVLCGRAVRRIHLDDRRCFAAAELDTGDRLAARRCICTTHPKLMLEMVPPEVFTPAYRRRIGELEETPSAVVLFGRCRPGDFAGNLILATEPRTVMDWTQASLEDRPLFVSVPSDAENCGVSVICPATLADLPGNGDGRERPQGYREWKAQIAQRLLQRLSDCAGDVLEDFELLDVATPLTFRDYLSSPQGGLYGVKHRLEDMPLLPRTAVKGLYLSGQAVAAPGVLGALCAGFLTESSIR